MQGLIKILWKVHEPFPLIFMFRLKHYLSTYGSGVQIILNVIVCIYFSTAEKLLSYN